MCFLKQQEQKVFKPDTADFSTIKSLCFSKWIIRIIKKLIIKNIALLTLIRYFHVVTLSLGLYQVVSYVQVADLRQYPRFYTLDAYGAVIFECYLQITEFLL